MGRSIGALIRKLRKEKGLTQRALAAAVGIHHTYLSKLENGRVDVTPTAENLIAMAEVFGIDPDTFLAQCGRTPESVQTALRDNPDCISDIIRPESTDHDEEDKSSSYPLLGQVVAGHPAEAIEDTETFDLADLFAPGEHYLLRVRGDSMIEDAIVDGDLAIVRPQKTCRDGETIVAIVDGDEATLKRFYREGDWVRLQPANSDMDPIMVEASRMQVCGIVVGMIRSRL